MGCQYAKPPETFYGETTMNRSHINIASLLAFAMFAPRMPRQPRERVTRNPDIAAAKIAAAKEKRLRRQRRNGGNV